MQFREPGSIRVGHEQLDRRERADEDFIDPLAERIEPLAAHSRHEQRIAMAVHGARSSELVEQVGLVEHQQAGALPRSDLVEHDLDRAGHRFDVLLGRAGVDDVQNQRGAAGLLERGGEGVDELMGKLAKEADRIAQQIGAAVDLECAGRRIERVKETVGDRHIGAGQCVQQCRLAGVGVARQRDLRQRRALSLAAHHPSRGVHVAQPPAQHRDAVAR